jgi:hypothetical protein
MKKRYEQQKANNSPPEPSGLSRRKFHSRADEFVAVIFQGQPEPIQLMLLAQLVMPRFGWLKVQPRYVRRARTL